MKHYAFDRASVLMVDDSAWMRIILRQMLKSMGFSRIQEAGTAEAAIGIVQAAPPDLVLTDWHMDPTDGLELTRRIRQLPGEARFVPVIMISAFSTLGNVLAARNAGVNEFLVKPVSPRTMYHHLVAVIERPRLFIEAPGYTGPDRRRRGASDAEAPRRRHSDHEPDALARVPADTRLTQNEISAIMSCADEAPTQRKAANG